MAKGKKRIMKELKINEISSVDVPAQAGARMQILKRDESTEEENLVEKVMILTSVEDGHQHVMFLDFDDVQRGGGHTGYSASGDDDREHDHGYVINADGSISIGANSGHTHSVEIGALMGRLQLQSALADQEVQMRHPDADNVTTEVEELNKVHDNKVFKANDFALIGDATDPTTWKYPLVKKSGRNPDRRLVGSAVAALKRGKIPEEHIAVFTRRVRKAWKHSNAHTPLSDMPSVLKKVSV